MKGTIQGSLIVAVLLAGQSSEVRSETALGRDCRAAAAFRIDGGVDYDKLQAASAVALCAEALAETPGDLSLLAFHSRALRKAGRTEEAVRTAKTSAEGGNPIGQ